MLKDYVTSHQFVTYDVSQRMRSSLVVYTLISIRRYIICPGNYTEVHGDKVLHFFH